MKLHLAVLLAIVPALSCGASSMQLPPATRDLQNPSFDEPGDALTGWARRNEQAGRARIVQQPVVSPPGALELVVQGKGAVGTDSFMIYQVLDPAPYRGRRVQFGARVHSDGGAVNITLYTPERTANDFSETLETDGYVERSGTLDVPENASFLSFGIQIMGTAGGRAYVDDVFVRIPGERAAGPAPAGTGPQTAEVRIDAGRPDGRVQPLIFGMHLEWSEAGNGLVDRGTGDLRRDVLQAFEPLRIPLFRFPGGIHADYYDWRAGAEPRGRRANRRNVFTGKDEPDVFGSPEFIELLKATGAQPLVTANYGTGSPEDTAAWARFFRDAGAPVTYWEVGNEIYLADPERDQPNGRRIARTGEQYGADFGRFHDAIKSVTPEAKVGLIAHVDSGAFPLAPAARRDWTTRMLGALRVRGDFVAVHNAYAPVVIDNSVRLDDDAARARAYRALYAAPLQTQEDLEAMAALLDRYEPTRGLPIGITEWGPLFGYSSQRDIHSWYVDQSRTMAAAVYVASMLDTLVAHRRVLLATYTNPIHRWYGSLLTDTDRGLVKTPSYHAVSMYRNRFESRLVPVAISGPTFNSEPVGLVKAHQGVPEVLARATVSDDGRRLTAMIVNRSLDRMIPTRLIVQGFTASRADCQLLAAPSPNAITGPGLTGTTRSGQAIEPRPFDCSAGAEMSLALPPSALLSVVLESR